MRCAALISFMAALTFMSGSMSVTSVWMIMKPNEDIDFVSCSLTSCAISSLVCNAAGTAYIVSLISCSRA